MKIPELLCPAGNPEKLRAAVDYGADAVYFAGSRFGMRSAADNFTLDEIREGVQYAHARSSKAYLAVNVMPHEDELSDLERYLKDVRDSGIDAFIAADLGVMGMMKRICPEIPVHVSTQANVVSSNACLAYAALGAKRIVLARELTLKEVSEIRRNLPDDIELEVFVHGSMCISNSGRCLISNHFCGRDANRGMCAQPCRWEYTLTEAKHQDEPIYAVEDPATHETFIMSSKDLCMIGHIPELAESGVDSLKIEGRMKSAYYTAVVANTYRMALDLYRKDPSSYVPDPGWMRELESVSHREYATGFFFDLPGENAQTVTRPGYIRDKSYLAFASEPSDSEGFAEFTQKNKFSEGDRAELVTPGSCGRSFVLDKLYDENGDEIGSAPHPMMKVRTRVPFEVKKGDILRKD